MTLDPASIANRRWRRVAEMAPQAGEGKHVPSPCQSVCIMHPTTGWCEGCLRRIDEIAAWAGLDDDTKRTIWAALPARRVRWLELHPPQAGRHD